MASWYLLGFFIVVGFLLLLMLQVTIPYIGYSTTDIVIILIVAGILIMTGAIGIIKG